MGLFVQARTTSFFFPATQFIAVILSISLMVTALSCKEFGALLRFFAFFRKCCIGVAALCLLSFGSLLWEKSPLENQYHKYTYKNRCIGHIENRPKRIVFSTQQGYPVSHDALPNIYIKHIYHLPMKPLSHYRRLLPK